jgi:hypothetical protein
MGRPVNDLFVLRSQAEEKKRKKVGPNAQEALSRINFSPSRAMCGPDFTLREQMFEASQLLKGQSENF